MASAMDPFETSSRTRNRAMADAMDTLGDLPVTQEGRCRLSDLHLAIVADKNIVEEHAQRRGPEAKALRDADHASPVGGVDAAISGWTAGECSRLLHGRRKK